MIKGEENSKKAEDKVKCCRVREALTLESVMPRTKEGTDRSVGKDFKDDTKNGRQPESQRGTK